MLMTSLSLASNGKETFSQRKIERGLKRMSREPNTKRPTRLKSMHEISMQIATPRNIEVN